MVVSSSPHSHRTHSFVETVSLQSPVYKRRPPFKGTDGVALVTVLVYFQSMHVFWLMLVLAQGTMTDRYIAAQQAYAADTRSEEKLIALVSILYQRDQNAPAIALLESFVKAAPRA